MPEMNAFRLAAVLALAAAPLLAAAQKPASPANSPAQPRPVTPRGPLAPDEQAVVGLFERASHSVAYITTQGLARRGLFVAEVQQGAGSGFVWDERGHIVTNHHVVAGAEKVQVQLDPGRTFDAKVIGVAPDYDLAVVKLDAPVPGLKPIAVGTSKELRIGQTVYAIGNPFGLTRTLTRGVLSALDRQLPTSDIREIAGVLQTDAAINVGNSGGPLLDSAGRLIGVTTAIRSTSGGSVGVGLAIPVDLVNRVVPQLISRGRAPQPGIGIVPFHPDVVARAGLVGVVIERIQPGSPAAQAGLKPYDRQTGNVGDVIVAVNGRAVESLPNFASELDRVGVDEVAELAVIRDGKERRVKVKVVDLTR
jgi:2-alkenal reductase